MRQFAGSWLSSPPRGGCASGPRRRRFTFPLEVPEPPPRIGMDSVPAVVDEPRRFRAANPSRLQKKPPRQKRLGGYTAAAPNQPVVPTARC